jgi:hypothetical protein
MSFHLDPKWIAKSWTLWLNVLVFLAALAVDVTNIPDLDWIDPKTVILVQCVANALLRLKTDQPVTVKRPKRRSLNVG